MVDSPGVGSSAAGATPQRGSLARAARAGGLEASPAPGPPPPARVLRSPALLARLGSGPRRSGQLRPNRGQRGSWKHPEPAAQGPRGPNQGGLRSAVVSIVGVRGWKGLYGPLMEGVPGQRRGL